MANYYFKSIVFYIFILSILGCGSETTNKNVGFSLNQFFDNEIKQLNAKNLKLNKTILQGDSVFSSEITNPKWEKELAIFKQYGEIKNTQIKLYNTDTFKLDNGNYFISLRAQNIKQALKLIELQFNKDHSIEKVTLLIQEEKTLNNHEMNLTYLPQKGYDIKGEINSKVSNNIAIDIHGEIVENFK